MPVEQFAEIPDVAADAFWRGTIDMPGKEVNRDLLVRHSLKESVRPVLAPGQRRPTNLEIWETALQMSCCNGVELEELLLCPAPAPLVGFVVLFKVGFVPYLPIADVPLEAIGPTLVVVTDDMFADSSPLRKVIGRQSPVFLRPVLYGLAQTEEHLRASLADSPEVCVREHEVIACRGILVCREVRKHGCDVACMGTARDAVYRVMRPGKRDPGRLVRREVLALLAASCLDRSVVHRVHRLYRANFCVWVNDDFGAHGAEGNHRQQEEQEFILHGLHHFAIWFIVTKR